MAEQRRVVVTGATGLIGRALCARLTAKGYQVVIFSRDPQKARRLIPDAAEYVAWQPATHGTWASALNGAYGVVHLAGAPIFGKRWSEEYKRELYESRIVSTRVLFSALIAAQQKPLVLVSGSAIGYYGARDDTPLDETAPPGNDFLAHLCTNWEQEAIQAEELGIRTVLLRTGIVLDANEGALSQMILPFRFFMGGPILPGTQWISWVHRDDEIGLILFALDNADVRGPLNVTAPEPQRNRDFMATLGRVLGTPSWLPVPGEGLKLLFGDLAEQMVTGQRVIPKKAQEHGYRFSYPTLESALRNLMS